MKTKKQFKKECRIHKYTGAGIYINAVFYDWQVTEQSRGFKWVIFGKEVPKKDIIDWAYRIAVLGERSYPWMINVKNDKLYRVPLQFGWL